MLIYRYFVVSFVLRENALATLRNNKREIPINRKRLIAGWDNEFLWELILHEIWGLQVFN